MNDDPAVEGEAERPEQPDDRDDRPDKTATKQQPEQEDASDGDFARSTAAAAPVTSASRQVRSSGVERRPRCNTTIPTAISAPTATSCGAKKATRRVKS